MTRASARTRQILAHIAGLHARAKHALAVGLPATGTALGEVLAYAKEFEDLRHELWRSDPQRFRHLSHDRYSSSISSRHEVLAHIVRDAHGILVTASHMGLCDEPPALTLPEVRATNHITKFLRDPVIQIAVAVIAGGIIYYLGWTR